MNKKDYYFYIVWEDQEKNANLVGILAQIDNEYYLKLNRKGENSKSAYDRGYIGIPGFQEEKVYKSSELFDFFKSKVLDKNSSNPCEEFLKNSGKSMTDSFYLEEVPDTLKEKIESLILQLHKIQQNKRKENEAHNL